MNTLTKNAGIALLVVAFYLIFTEWDQRTFDSESDYDVLVDTLADSGLIGFSESDASELIKTRTIVSTTDVNAHFSHTITSKLLILNSNSREEPIELYLRSEGGWEDDAFAVTDIMQMIDAPVNVHAIGGVHSAGLVILSAATGKRYVYEETILGYHCLSEGENEQYASRYQTFFRAHTNLPEEWITNRTGEFMYFTAQEAVKYGVADEILHRTIHGME